jgi:hypothetical protein
LEVLEQYWNDSVSGKEIFMLSLMLDCSSDLADFFALTGATSKLWNRDS